MKLLRRFKAGQEENAFVLQLQWAAERAGRRSGDHAEGEGGGQ